MANPEHLAKLKEGVEAWNQWRKENPEILPDLLGVDLSDAHLSRINLSEADLRGTDFSRVDLSAADLSDADLTESRLFWANLFAGIMDGADFAGADLYAANFNWTYLSYTNFAGAKIELTNFSNVDFSESKGLETVVHGGPSTIGIDTIYKSKGKIPDVFLRGAGVPDNFIAFIPSLVAAQAGIEFYSLFISYSTKDQEFAKRLHADLQAKGVRCWFAPHDMRSGQKVHEQIDEAIRVYDKLLLILSPASMESEWVRTEISKAHKREIKEGKRILFPISICSFETLRDWECFDADAGKDSAREIREYFIPDFSNWKDHDAYKLAFDRLLDDLHGKAEPASV